MADDYADDDYEDDDYEDRPSRRGRRTKMAQRPGKVQAIAIMTLIGGILAALVALNWLIADASSMGICCLWPGQYYTIVLAILAIIKGSQLLGQDAHRQAPPKGIAIMMIVDIINFDIPNLVMGIIILVFCNDPEVERFFEG